MTHAPVDLYGVWRTAVLRQAIQHCGIFKLLYCAVEVFESKISVILLAQVNGGHIVIHSAQCAREPRGVKEN